MYSKCQCNPTSYFPPFLEEKYAHKKTKRQVLEDVDFIGLVLLVGELLIFLMGISWGGFHLPVEACTRNYHNRHRILRSHCLCALRGVGTAQGTTGPDALV